MRSKSSKVKKKQSVELLDDPLTDLFQLYTCDKPKLLNFLLFLKDNSQKPAQKDWNQSEAGFIEESPQLQPDVMDWLLHQKGFLSAVHWFFSACQKKTSKIDA